MMKKLKYVLERGYPYIIAISASIILQRVKGVLDNANFGELLSGIITLDSIVIGFFGAIMPVILSMKNESKFVRYVFENDKEGLFSKYLKITVFSGLLSAVSSLSMYLRDSFIHICVRGILYTVWIFVTALFLTSTYRSLSYMIMLVFSKDNFVIEETPKCNREKTETEKKMEQYYK